MSKAKARTQLPETSPLVTIAVHFPGKIPDEHIAQRAYALYLDREGEGGHDVEDWLRAERKLMEEAVIREAERRILSCEGCNPDEAEIPFEFVVDEVMLLFSGVHTEYIMEDSTKCGRCQRDVVHTTLIVPEANWTTVNGLPSISVIAARTSAHWH